MGTIETPAFLLTLRGLHVLWEHKSLSFQTLLDMMCITPLMGKNHYPTFMRMMYIFTTLIVSLLQTLSDSRL